MTEKKFYCSFCGKSQDDVCQIITTQEVSICNECVLMCVGLIADDNKAKANFPCGSMGEEVES